MDTRHFNRLTTTLSATSTRRVVLAGLIAAFASPPRPLAASTASSPADTGNGPIVDRGGPRHRYHYRVPNPGETRDDRNYKRHLRYQQPAPEPADGAPNLQCAGSSG